MLGQWTLEMNHVAAIVGGFDSQQKHIGQNGVRFTPISKARQSTAVRFLNENAFVTPEWAIDKEILRRIEAIGTLNRIRNAQNSVLNNLLSSARFARLVEQEALDATGAYHPVEFLADVRKGVWTELSSSRPVIDAYRRNLQRSYLDIANTKLNAPPPTVPAGLPPGFAALFISSGDERAFYRAELRAINAATRTALARMTDRATRVHLEGVRDQIAKILNPTFGGNSAAAPNINRQALEFLELYYNPTSCWPDYRIDP